MRRVVAGDVGAGAARAWDQHLMLVVGTSEHGFHANGREVAGELLPHWTGPGRRPPPVNLPRSDGARPRVGSERDGGSAREIRPAASG